MFEMFKGSIVKKYNCQWLCPSFVATKLQKKFETKGNETEKTVQATASARACWGFVSTRKVISDVVLLIATRRVGNKNVHFRLKVRALLPNFTCIIYELYVYNLRTSRECFHPTLWQKAS